MYAIRSYYVFVSNAGARWLLIRRFETSRIGRVGAGRVVRLREIQFPSLRRGDDFHQRNDPPDTRRRPGDLDGCIGFKLSDQSHQECAARFGDYLDMYRIELACIDEPSLDL